MTPEIKSILETALAVAHSEGKIELDEEQAAQAALDALPAVVFNGRDMLAAQSQGFEDGRQAVLRLLSRKPIVNAQDVLAIGNPFDGRNGHDR
jgi:hypothetical protein